MKPVDMQRLELRVGFHGYLESKSSRGVAMAGRSLFDPLLPLFRWRLCMEALHCSGKLRRVVVGMLMVLLLGLSIAARSADDPVQQNRSRSPDPRKVPPLAGMTKAAKPKANGRQPLTNLATICRRVQGRASGRCASAPPPGSSVGVRSALRLEATFLRPQTCKRSSAGTRLPVGSYTRSLCPLIIPDLA
jgi:hypothetical protein